MIKKKKVFYKKVNKLICFMLLLSLLIGLFSNKSYALKDENVDLGIRALYVRADIAAGSLEDINVQHYKQYIEALREKNTKRVKELEPRISSCSPFEKIVGLVLASDLNGLVINVKDDSGYVTIPFSSDIIPKLQSNNGYLKNIEEIMRKLKGYGIYTIARLVVFKDNVLSKHHEYTINISDNQPWLDYSKASWVNPYDKRVQDYNIEVALKAAQYGFDEIQFDYIRFPEKFSQFPVSEKYLKDNVRQDEEIRSFLKKAASQLKPLNVKIAADVFGCVAYLWDDPLNIDIGQVWYNLTQEVDYICPMVYPSHYRGTNWYTYNDPNKEPYKVVKGAIEDSLRINGAFNIKADIRFWIQDFSMYGYYYGPEQILDQVRALNEYGMDSYMFWNNLNIYEPDNFLIMDTREVEDISQNYYIYNMEDNNPFEVSSNYLNAFKAKDFYQLFVLSSPKNREVEYKDFVKDFTFSYLNDFSIKDYKISFNTAQVFFNQSHKDNSLVVFLVLEEGLWKINNIYFMN